MIYPAALITGCGGDIAQALARIARDTGVFRDLIGCDIHEQHPGRAYFRHCHVVPKARDSQYVDCLRQLIDEFHIDVVVPTAEAEISCLVEARKSGSGLGVPVIIANDLAIEIGLDKYATVEQLAASGIGVPWTCIVGDAPPLQVPCILKQRYGQGSKGLRLIETEADVANFSVARPGDLWQEQLLPDDQEYTCGLYRGRSGETRTLVIRRRLQGGLTSAGEVVASDEINGLLHAVADALDLLGSINVQLRLTQDGPKVFEVNPRFSSTVGFRNKLGFRDFVWSLLEARGLDIESYCPPSSGTKIYRAAHEIIMAS